MPFLSPADTSERLENVVHFDTQASAETGLDLTASSLYALTTPGQLDFGGSEEKAAERRSLDPTKEDPEDDYGWWDLDPGSYLVRYNESLGLSGEGTAALVLPHERLLAAGAHHPAFCLRPPREADAPIEALLAVGTPGLRIKENSRLSTLLLLEA